MRVERVPDDIDGRGANWCLHPSCLLRTGHDGDHRNDRGTWPQGRPPAQGRLL